MKRKRTKPKFRIPMPPPQKPHSTKKGKRGYRRQGTKRATHTTREEAEMDEHMEGPMAELYKATTRQEVYQKAIRNLSSAQIALVEKWMLTPEEECEINVSSVLSYAREKFLELRPYLPLLEKGKGRHMPPYF